MKDASRIFALLVLLAAFAVPMARAQQAATVMGTVTDADTGEPLPGASILVSRSASGAVAKSAPTDANGRYIIEGLTPGAYVISASYVGYATVQQDVQLTSGQTLPVVFAMRPGEVGLNDLVVTASRRREKVLEAPASVSVLTSGDIEHQVTVSAVDLLKKTVGVDIARTGIDREEVVLRGFNNAFSGAAYVMTDYRQAAVASLGVNAYDMMPISNIDLDRIEVVRGPGSALYGPGVDAGVIHFITKSPFTYPGTTIAVSGGQRSFLAVQGRHAGVINDRIGYKITGLYSQAEDWHLDPAHDAMDAIQDSLYHRVNARNYDVNKANVNGTVEYRFSPSMVLAANAGYATAQSVFLSGIGTLQADGFGYTYGQLRLSAGDFFAQAYVNKNNAGNSFVYAGPAVASSLSGQAVMDNSLQYNAQAQYGVGLMQDRERITFGADYEVTTPRTNGTITGRNEGDDTIIEYGAYGQSETRLTNQLNLTLAARLDYDNVYEALQLSPRAAVVFTPTPEHSFRATYNRAFASPGSNSLFLDIAARDRVLATGAPYHLIIQARGAASGFTFDDYRGSKEGRFSLPVPNFFGQDFNLSAIPLVPIYGAAAAGGLVTYLGSPAPLPGPLAALTPQQRGLLANLLGYTAQNGSLGTSMTGAIQLGTPDEAAAIGYRPVSGPIDIAPLKQTVTQTVELGYKGLVANRLIVAIDGYWTQKKNFVGPLLIGSPFAYLQEQGLSQDVGVALGTLFASTSDQTIQALLGQLNGQGIPPAQAAAILAGLVGNAMNDLPAAVVQPDQQVLATNDPTAVGGFLTYRSFGDLSFYGIDAASQLIVTSRLNLFGNVSWVSDNSFDYQELGEDNPDLHLSLNAPSMKWRAGFDYAVPKSFSFNAAGRYTGDFDVQTGPYSGHVDSYFLLDLGAGYDFARFAPGLRMDVSVYNVLDDEHREFVGAPKIGRLALLRLTYSM